MVKNGFGQIPILISLLVMVLALPLATKLVQQNTENRGKATSDAIHLPTSAPTSVIIRIPTSDFKPTSPAQGAIAKLTEAVAAPTSVLVLKSTAIPDSSETDITTQPTAYPTPNRPTLQPTLVSTIVPTIGIIRIPTSDFKPTSPAQGAIAKLTETVAAPTSVLVLKSTAIPDSSETKPNVLPTTITCPAGSHLWLGECRTTLKPTIIPTTSITCPSGTYLNAASGSCYTRSGDKVSPIPTVNINIPKPDLPFSDKCDSGYCVYSDSGRYFVDLGTEKAYEEYAKGVENWNKVGLGVVAVGAVVAAPPVVNDIALSALVKGLTYIPTSIKTILEVVGVTAEIIGSEAVVIDQLKCYLGKCSVEEAAIAQQNLFTYGAALQIQKAIQEGATAAVEKLENKAIETLKSYNTKTTAELTDSGINSFIRNSSNDEFLALKENKTVVGYFSRKNNEVIIREGNELYATSHENIHAKRQLDGSFDNLYDFVENSGISNSPSAEDILYSLEEVGTISDNLALYESIDGLPSYLSSGERNYLARNTQRYLEALKNSNNTIDMKLFNKINYPERLSYGEKIDSLNALHDVVDEVTGKTNYLPYFYINSKGNTNDFW